MLIYEGDISNYLGVNIKKTFYGKFELSQSHLVEKIINHLGLKVSEILESIDTTSGKPLLHKDKYSQESKYIWYYRAVVVVLSCLQGSTLPEISMAIHHCACFFQ